MASPRQEKQNMKKAILQIVYRDTSIEYEKLVSIFKLETAFSKKIIVEMISDMINVGMIKQIGDDITVVIQQKTEEEVPK